MGGAVRQQDEDVAPGLVPAVVVKGKRSKRQRVHAPPVVLTAVEWSSSAASPTAAAPAGEEADSAASVEEEAASTGGCVTEEEEDMALCLMLLSRGEPAAAPAKDGEHQAAVVVNKETRFRSRRPAADGGEFVYECKTCNKCFPSFQALGGHRTSHKKPRLIPPSSDDKNNNNSVTNVESATTTPTTAPSPPSSVPALAEDTTTVDATVLAISVPAVVPKQEPGTAVVVASAGSSSSRHPRVHECSICGAEFGSGQALGGHMRRHRPLVPAAAAARDTTDAPPRKEKSLLELDLNMPAPCDEAEVTSPRFAAFAAVAERQPAPLLFPAALVDCHY